MKNKIIILTTALAMIFMVGCENALEKSVAFDVTPQLESGVVSGNSFSVTTGTPVTFNFAGDPDFITFFSGEPGHEYSKIDLLEVPASDITSVLKFDNMPQYGTIPNSLKLFVSTDFTGLTGKNKQTDSTMIVTHQWKDISSLANFSEKSNQTNKTEISLDEYLGKKLTIAFKYDPGQNTATQPTWVLTNMLIENTVKATNEVSQLKAATLGFIALDMISTIGTPYRSNGGAGVWDLRNIASTTVTPNIRIQSSPSGQPINEDWLVSNPILINSRPADKGVAIKKMSVDVNSYVYTFNAPGTYTVTFLGRNSNYEHFSEMVKEFTVTVN